MVKIRQHARPNRWTATIRLPEGNHVALHRTDDPLGEARAQLATSGARDPRVIAIVGAGLGYLTQAAHERFPNARIVVLEPIPVLAQGALSRTPALYASGQVRIVIGPRFDNAGELWRLFDVESPDEPDPPLLLSPVLQRAVPAAIATAVLLVRRATGGARMNARARREHAGRYVVNTLRNLPHIIKGVDPQRLIGQFGGVPAVLVAAGPSLDQNLPALRQFADRALIVATDTAWRPLVSAGIDPHLVISLDPSTLNGRHLTGVTSRRDTWLFAEASVEPDALRAFAGRVGTFRVGMHHPWPWLAQLGVNRPLAQVWGSVLTAAFDLSLAFGCDPLIFVGADLSFTDQRPYCRGTTFERAWARYAAEGVSLRQIWRNTIAARASLLEDDVHGQRVLTAANLVEFRNWLVAHSARQTGRRVINATGAGILFGPGIDQADLASVLEASPSRGETVRDTIRRLLSLRTVSVHLRPVMDALGEIEQATADSAAGTSSSPIPEWLAFGRPSLTVASIHAAATDGLADLERPWPQADPQAEAPNPRPEAPALRLHEADRVARMRALLTSDRTVLDGCASTEAKPNVRPRRAWASDISGVLSTLLAMPTLTDSAGGAITTTAPGSTVPLSCRFSWNSAATPWVASLEELLLEAWAPPAREHSPEGAQTDFWSGWVVPVADEPEESASEHATDDEEQARFELTSLRIALLADECEAGNRRQERLARALAVGAADPALRLPPGGPYFLELLAEGSAAPVRVRVDALTRALTGTLAWVTGSSRHPVAPDSRVWSNLRSVTPGGGDNADPRLAFLARDVDYVEPEILTAGQLARGFSLGPAPGDRVVFVPSGSTSSVHISPDGMVEPASTWPVPITGEVPWGTEGGALAWNGADSTILLRRQADAPPVIEKVPFRPARLALASDGTAFWSAAGGGIWTWVPGRSGCLLVDTPSWGGLFLDGSDLVLPPVIRDGQGHIVRQRLNYEWRCALGTSTLRRVDAAREGQCFGAARQGKWTARPYPFSDLVRLESPDGDALALACHTPTSAVWAGHSLVVGTSEGTVLVFRGLLDRLMRLSSEGSTIAP